jgi:polyphosphate kinase
MIHHDFLPTLPSLLAHSNIPLIHRDLSWLQFNERVLAEARSPANPLLERAKFVAISASNLDEFFMIRLASLGRSIGALTRTDAPGAARLSRIRSSLLENVAKFGAKQAEALDLVASELEAEGIRFVRPQPGGNGSGPSEDFALTQACFDEQVLPRLGSPEGFTHGKLSQLENLQIGAVFKSNVWFRIPRALPSVLKLADDRFVFLDDLLAMHLGPAFRLEGQPGFVRLTRDGDFTVDLEEEDTESIPDVVRTGIRTREKGRPVRLQYAGDVSETLLRQAAVTLRLVAGQVLPAPHSLCLHGLWTVVSQLPEALAARPAISHPAFHAPVPASLRDPSRIFDELKLRDHLLHHPYDSFDGYVNWIRAACEDPAVEMIEQTVYRTDTLSPVIAELKKAASRKRIRVLIELRARFDELNNLALADDLRRAGIEVAFGFGKLKLHAKVALVTRRENGQAVLYTHLSTGNYNSFTARQYTDLAILTANPEIGADAKHFLDKVSQGEVPTSFKRLVSAPTRLHRRLLAHIQAETDAAKNGRKARIVAKVNALVDDFVIDHLYKASQAGVQVDLIVRGACSLIPGVKGLSENVRVISIVDRFLEHSRLYYFGDSRALYLSSADWMPRNFFSRLEIAFPVTDPLLYQYLEQVVIPTYLADTVKARELTPQGTWKKRALRGKALRSQFFFQDLAAREYAGTPLAAGAVAAADPPPA